VILSASERLFCCVSGIARCEGGISPQRQSQE
jgi:hypothetical protein